MGTDWLYGVALIATAPILAALMCVLAERTAALYLDTPADAGRPAGSWPQVALSTALGLGVAGVALWAWGPAWRVWSAFALALAFLYGALVDAKTRLLPHIPAGLAAGLGLLWAWLDHGWAGLGAALVGGLSAGAVIWGIGAACRVWVRREALGLGDVYLAAAGGVLLGPTVIWTALAAAAGGTATFVLALRCMRGNAGDLEIPFGPGLFAAIWIAWAASQGRW